MHALPHQLSLGLRACFALGAQSCKISREEESTMKCEAVCFAERRLRAQAFIQECELSSKHIPLIQIIASRPKPKREPSEGPGERAEEP